MILGQSPGSEEIKAGRPFVGKSGAEQRVYLTRHGLDVRDFYVTNAVKEFVKPKVSPTQAQVGRWRDHLRDELREVAPDLIIAVGAFAARALLGPCTLEACHGLPHRVGEFDASVRDEAIAGGWSGACVVPVHHPAAGMYNGDIRALVNYDYEQAARWVRAVSAGEPVEYRHDEWAGVEAYSDVTGAQFATVVDSVLGGAVGYDTEGYPDAPWSMQVAVAPGGAYVLRYSQPDFALGAAAVVRAISRGVRFIAHNWMHDMAVSRAMGVEFRHARLLDTMYQAAALKLEPQGLKALEWRWNGRKRTTYKQLVGDGGVEKQVGYLARVIAGRWAANVTSPEPRVVFSNDGTMRIYKPQSVVKRAVGILSDYAKGVAGSDDDDSVLEAEEADSDDAATPSTDLRARWLDIDSELRASVEAALGGPMPRGTLDDVELAHAIAYAGADADGVLRLAPKLERALALHHEGNPVERGMRALPIFETIQANGIPASRTALVALRADIDARLAALQARISRDYWGGEPFNPMSGKHVDALLKKRGLKAAKVTKKTGAVSTAKGSLEHLRDTDPAVDAIFDFRELLKTRQFCDVADRMDASEGAPDVQAVCGQVKTTRIPTRRIAMSDPNLLQIPTRNELGRAVKACYVAPPGQLLGSWDLSTIEVRVAAHLSRDPVMCDQLVNRGSDLHTETAARIFNIAMEEVDKKRHRDPAKRCTFGCLYGIGGEGLYTQFRTMGLADGWDAQRCDGLIRSWFRVYAGVQAAIDETARRVREVGYVVEPFSGARRYLPGVWSDDRGVRNEAERQAFNHRVQGAAQTMLQESMVWLWGEIEQLRAMGVRVEWRLQLHDELIFTFDEEAWELMDALVQEALTQHSGVELCVPVKAEGRCARTWAELK